MPYFINKESKKFMSFKKLYQKFKLMSKNFSHFNF